MGEEIARRRIATGSFLTLESIQWRDRHGRESDWETANRKTSRPAALIIAWLQPSDRLVLVRQYRPPAGGDVIEFPAGLIDAGESPEDAALRELREETGYHGTIVGSLPPAFNTPGLSSECTHIVLVRIDETLPQNLTPHPQHEDGEEIQVLLVPRTDLPAFYRDEIERGTPFDSKVTSSFVSQIMPVGR